MKGTKLTKKMIIIGIIVAVIYLVAASFLRLPQKAVLSGIVVIWAAIMVIRMYIVNANNKEHAKMLDHLNKILTEDNDPEKYIQKCNDYIEKIDDEVFKSMLKLNSATGYSCIGKYEEAINTIKEVDFDYLNPSHKAVAINNLAQYSYFLGRNEEATKYVDDNFDTMQRFLNTKSFSASFMTTFAFYYYFKGNKNKANKYTNNILEFIKNSGSTSEGDMMVVKKMNELLEKIEAMPNPEDLYGDDE